MSQIMAPSSRSAQTIEVRDLFIAAVDDLIRTEAELIRLQRQIQASIVAAHQNGRRSLKDLLIIKQAITTNFSRKFSREVVK
jgi:predicted nucleic acid-binding protein